MSHRQHADPAQYQPRLVGRERELAILRERLAALPAGSGSLVLVGGDPGIGKTHLVEAALRESHVGGAFTLVGHCYDRAGGPAYGPWVDLFLRYPVSAEVPELPPAFAMRGSVGKVASQLELFAQVQEFFVRLTRVHPVLVVIEDLHWADPASLDLLGFLAHSTATLPLLIIGTIRRAEPQPVADLLPILTHATHPLRLDLRPLSAGDVRALVDVGYRLSETDAQRLTDYLLERSEGNPLFLVELLRTLEEEALLRPVGSGHRLGEPVEIGVPALLQQVITARVRRLGDDALTLLSWAAMVGQEAPLDLWAAVAGVTEEAVLRVTEAAVAARLLRALPDGDRVRFTHALVRDALYEGMLPPRRRRMHLRVAEVAEALPLPDPDFVAYQYQQAGDARAARWLIRAAQRAERAYAWITAAERLEAALPLLETDPESSRLRGWVLMWVGHMLRYSAPARGIAYLDEACRVAERVGDRALRGVALAHVGLDRQMAWEIQRGTAELEAGVAIQETLTRAEWMESYRLQRTLLDPLPDDIDPNDPRTFDAMQLTSQQIGELFFWLAIPTLRYREIVERGEPHARRIEAVGDDLLVRHNSSLEGASWIDTYLGLGISHAALGHVEAAERAFARATALYQAVGYHMMVVGATMNHAWVVQLPYRADDQQAHAGWVAASESSAGQVAGQLAAGQLYGLTRLPLLVLQGAWDEARQVATCVTDEFPSGTTAYVEVAMATIARAQGDTAAAWAIIERRLPLGPASDPAATVALCAFDWARLAAALHLDSGDLAGAQQWLAAHDRWLAESGRVLGAADGQVLWARYHRLAGGAVSAAMHAGAALDLASAPRQPVALLAIHRLLGELALDDQHWEQAERHLALALELASACGAPFERALTLVALAQVRMRSGALDRVAALLEDACAICSSLGARPTLDRIAALEAQVAPRESVAGRPAGLTLRELDVLRLVVDGLSDREIGERLSIGTRTVQTHVTSILAKLGANSRTAAATHAVRHGIV